MASGKDVLSMLIPTGGWVIVGDEYEGIQFIEAEPISKAEFEAGFDKFDDWKIEQDKLAVAKKTALLDKLGITAEEAQLLLGQ